MVQLEAIVTVLVMVAWAVPDATALSDRIVISARPNDLSSECLFIMIT